MPTPVATSTIVAQAFRLMELSPVSSFGDDSEQAAAAAEQYPVALDICLEACDWSFASTLADLPALAALPDGVAADARLPHTFRLPGDCVTLREMVDPSAHWRRDDDLIRADRGQTLTIRYTRRIVNENAASASFRTAVAYQLASLLAPRWVGKASLQQGLADGAQLYLKRAMSDDRQAASSERYDGRPEQPDWLSEAMS